MANELMLQFSLSIFSHQGRICLFEFEGENLKMTRWHLERVVLPSSASDTRGNATVRDQGRGLESSGISVPGYIEKTFNYL